MLGILEKIFKSPTVPTVDDAGLCFSFAVPKYKGVILLNLIAGNSREAYRLEIFCNAKNSTPALEAMLLRLQKSLSRSFQKLKLDHDKSARLIERGVTGGIQLELSLDFGTSHSVPECLIALEDWVINSKTVSKLLPSLESRATLSELILDSHKKHTARIKEDINTYSQELLEQICVLQKAANTLEVQDVTVQKDCYNRIIDKLREKGDPNQLKATEYAFSFLQAIVGDSSSYTLPLSESDVEMLSLGIKVLSRTQAAYRISSGKEPEKIYTLISPDEAITALTKPVLLGTHGSYCEAGKVRLNLGEFMKEMQLQSPNTSTWQSRTDGTNGKSQAPCTALALRRH